MNINELDSITKNLVQEIIRECTNRNVIVSHDLVIYYVQLLLLDPKWKINLEVVPERVDSQKFVKYCLRMFEDQTTSQMIALKMQLFFKNNYETMHNSIIKNRTDLKNRLSPLEKEIIRANPTSGDEYEKLYKKIIYLVTLYSGLGNPTFDEVFKEAKKALYSIFNETDLLEFISSSPNQKEDQLVELTELTTGIRLFNRDCHKGGNGIEDLPILLDDAIAATIFLIEQRLLSIMNYVNTLTTAIDNSYTTEFGEENCYNLKLTVPVGISEEDINNFKNVLIVYRQYEMYIRILKYPNLVIRFIIQNDSIFKERMTLVEVEKIDKEAKSMFSKLQESLKELHETVKFRILIPTANIFVDGEKLSLLLESAEVLNDAERLERTANLEITPLNNKEAVVLNPSNFKNFDKIHFEYLGFCPWKFIETNGALIPGNPNMGVIQVKNLNFSFSSVEAAAAFGQAPYRYVLRGIDLGRDKLEVINLLGLKQQLEAVRKVSQLVKEIQPVILKTSEGVQTDVHAIPTLIDPNYKWNVWDWKRQAILLANISSCQTHGTQSYNSQSREHIRVQTYSPREIGVQTKKDNYTNAPTLSNFIYGLRGTKENVHHVITLTRPVDE